jgi:hypothetical protein
VNEAWAWTDWFDDEGPVVLPTREDLSLRYSRLDNKLTSAGRPRVTDPAELVWSGRLA